MSAPAQVVLLALLAIPVSCKCGDTGPESTEPADDDDGAGERAKKRGNKGKSKPITTCSGTRWRGGRWVAEPKKAGERRIR